MIQTGFYNTLSGIYFGEVALKANPTLAGTWGSQSQRGIHRQTLLWKLRHQGLPHCPCPPGWGEEGGGLRGRGQDGGTQLLEGKGPVWTVRIDIFFIKNSLHSQRRRPGGGRVEASTEAGPQPIGRPELPAPGLSPALLPHTHPPPPSNQAPPRIRVPIFPCPSS